MEGYKIKKILNNTEKEVSESLAYTRKIGEVMELIQKLTGKDLEKGSLAYIRTMNHINFMIERVEKNKPIKNELLESIRTGLAAQYSIAIKIAMKIENLFSLTVPEDEIGYIALHINRLVG